MAEGGSWESISEHGLLSTSALLDLFEYEGEERVRIEARHRPTSIPISHEQFGLAVIRDQKPMSDSGIERCAEGFTPAEWYRLLNGKVFFWATKERLLRMLNAGAYKNSAHDVLIVDTRQLVSRHAERMTLSPMNSGATKPFPHPRGANTFLPIDEYPFDHWRLKRGRQGDPLVEVAVEHGVPDVSDFVVRVQRMQRGQILEVIWSD